MIFADVIIDISVKSLDRAFQYIVPADMEDNVEIGSLVAIPFGAGNRILKGYVIGLSVEPKFDLSKTKSIIGVEKQGVVAESHLLSLAYWIKENYGSTMNDAIKCVMPVKREIKEKLSRTIYPLVDKKEMLSVTEELKKKHNTARVRLTQAFLSLPEEEYFAGIDYSVAVKELKITASVLEGLKELGIIDISSKREYRGIIKAENIKSKRHILNDEQRNAAEGILNDYRNGIRKTYLLHGVTGSGKTEVYMDIIEGVIGEGGQVIVLIPEIALTFQTVNRFYKRFGERISVIHSRLSAGERYDQYIKAKDGGTDIMIGPRSALFTPFKNLGLIVIDEEHETSYQSEMPPKYHAREVAVKRAKMLGASVVLGSATPSLEAYHRAVKDEYKMYQIKMRAGNAVFPNVDIVDLRNELEKKNYSIFSERLSELMYEKLSRHEQIILFINRRGYAGFVSCRKCGSVIGCKHCSVSLKPHMVNGKVDRLKCHYCGYEIPMPPKCPECGSVYIGTFGLGTQQVEEMVKKKFPQAKVLRMDADTTGGKQGHERILKEFGQHKADILIGTQMIVKGHDFPDVTLVGIIAADLSLNSGDYRAAERTFQLIAQAAGRAGRGDKVGNVVIQTYQPEHYSIVCAASHDYVNFYKQEILARQMLQYPPISNILGVLVLSQNEKSAAQLSVKVYEIMKIYEDISILGPTDAAVAKTNDVYRKMVYGKCVDYNVLLSAKNSIEEFKEHDIVYKDCIINFEINYI